MNRRAWPAASGIVQGMSTSLPEDVQWEMYRSVPGLEHAELTRLAYAIEYDCIDSRELRPTLESLRIGGLYLSPDRSTAPAAMRKPPVRACWRA